MPRRNHRGTTTTYNRKQATTMSIVLTHPTARRSAVEASHQHAAQAALMTALAVLDTSPHSIAGTLTALGVRGERSCSRHCPIATWLHDVTQLNVAVSDTAATVIDGPHAGVTVELPHAVRRFAAHHDLGRWPELTAGDGEPCGIVPA